ncbi:hypothetical protein HMPREF1321_1459 [Capnocytophaga sp. oral taxon 412 str. F0487]|jgi:hypothetical protein|uniref:Uncharacterized protein n=1 Tax=Capnocytophaga ochracea (strain ATCC 27872 / DSM 7271 / CCUG 9716 / JCM 12966 / NCTC 12371 / SS31 / VPI 2845) TaxID=521097 RepID=C7M568_CAPOD|nr:MULTISPECIES: DUF5606 domain-containing protein [Capnocytophaga]ACU91768.1 conserved hypothetical protein [Capnocytophaga ochracea DSM 7271]EIW93516.1 hypothetical protein HMPREF1321_1459 [Capnocytophaga sp. oral taxon 412 str. F0487]EPE00003.1 hypothetical protein HMPREF1528_01368 [Capnocytophaga sp. oral taxon 336 str. F0502]UAK50540.1 DUF5606 domain-containing protein [Capnocytophaga ochracea]
MNLTKVLAISGKPGLYHLETQTRSGFLATSLADGKRISVGIRNNVSLLSEIAIYTLEKEVPLTEVFTNMKNFEEGKEARISPKSDGATLEEYFSQVLPNYDRDRVYASDIKKIIQWYNLLLAKGFLEEDAQEDTQKS